MDVGWMATDVLQKAKRAMVNRALLLELASQLCVLAQITSRVSDGQVNSLSVSERARYRASNLIIIKIHRYVKGYTSKPSIIQAIFALSTAVSLQKYVAEVKALLVWFERADSTHDHPVGGSVPRVTESRAPTLQPDEPTRQGLTPIALSFPSSPGVVVCNIYQTQNNRHINNNHSTSTRINCGNTTTTSLTNVGNNHCVTRIR
ncbi:hypothetical protein PC9H_001388 [Pleurotus ostreatus]|uniref:Uncharacterized protein n=1 Tax=Pleurotus ostreatus TaxID=5322 RepID=A0A8H7A597_PLEOS|nr:uncharacterized protein PC9H_001388 [Pleurotus ostreatus]KAF7441039.1 hypothetical protein PC9H_001388 [Pleurotus ostreatus]